MRGTDTGGEQGREMGLGLPPPYSLVVSDPAPSSKSFTSEIYAN